MKTFDQIKNLCKRGDYQEVAELAGCTRENVWLVVNGQRSDNFGIQKIFSEFLSLRSEMKRKHKRTIKQKTF